MAKYIKSNFGSGIISNAIFIIGCHKSGTSLLRSLLDGHPNLFVFPKETHFFQYAGYGTMYPIRKVWPQTINKQALIEGLYKGVLIENYGNDPYSDNPGFKGYNVDLFIDALKKSPLETPLQQIESYFHALHFSLTSKKISSDKRIVEKSVESAEHVPWLRLMAPECQFIHIVRNPYATLVSLRLSKMKSGRYPLMRPLINSLYDSAYHLFQNRRLINNYMVVRYEDLLSEPNNLMMKIAEYLNIVFDPILLRPTSFNEPWFGNSTSRVKYSCISKKPSEHWMGEINSYEISLVNRYLKPLILEFGYDHLNHRKKCFMPQPGESVRTFIDNRALLCVP